MHDTAHDHGRRHRPRCGHGCDCCERRWVDEDLWTLGAVAAAPLVLAGALATWAARHPAAGLAAVGIAAGITAAAL